jgi:nucleoside 2-deoxyribosyltransferase
MTRYFISYKFTGVGLEKLYNDLDPIVKSIRDFGHDVFCNLYSLAEYQENGFGTNQIMQHCFDEIEKSDVLIIYVTDTFGGGSAIECGYAIGQGLEILALIPKNSPETYTTLKALSHHIIEYTDQDDLLLKLSKLYRK